MCVSVRSTAGQHTDPICPLPALAAAGAVLQDLDSILAELGATPAQAPAPQAAAAPAAAAPEDAEEGEGEDGEGEGEGEGGEKGMSAAAKRKAKKKAKEKAKKGGGDDAGVWLGGGGWGVCMSSGAVMSLCPLGCNPSVQLLLSSVFPFLRQLQRAAQRLLLGPPLPRAARRCRRRCGACRRRWRRSARPRRRLRRRRRSSGCGWVWASP